MANIVMFYIIINTNTSIQIKIPTLISYGDLDDTISIAAIEPVIRTKFAPETTKVKSYPNSRHNFTTDPDAEDLFEGIYEFIKE